LQRRDIGAVAAGGAVRLTFKGQKTQELLGPRDMTYTEAAENCRRSDREPAPSLHGGPMSRYPSNDRDGNFEGHGALICEMSAAINSGYMKPWTAVGEEYDADDVRDIRGGSVFAGV